jgi:hypothetical protein
MKDNHSQLLIDIQRKSNINISKVRDVKFLKEEIESTIDSKIGYNTLRRLFGFLDGHSPSEKTLNRLSNYLGYNSFSNYLNNKSNYNDWYFQQYLLQLREKKKIDIAEISNINTGIKNENNLVYLGYFIGFHIERGNIQILISLFSQLDFRSISATQFMKFAIIITMSLSILSDRKSLSIYRTLIEFDNFRNQVPLLFIDYSNLYLRYNQVLQYIAANKANSSDSLFTKLMFAYKDYYIDQIDLSPTNYINKPIDFDDFYVTLN